MLKKIKVFLKQADIHNVCMNISMENVMSKTVAVSNIIFKNVAFRMSLKVLLVLLCCMFGVLVDF